MTDEWKRQVVRVPFLKGKKSEVPVVVEIESHPAIEGMAKWDGDLKRRIQEACFASYKDKLESIGPESLPRIRRSNEVWKHLSIQSIRIDPSIPNGLVVYVVPDWDESEHMEWCLIDNELVYVGQFVMYPIDGYKDSTYGNHAQPKT